MLLLWGLWETGTARAAAVPGPWQERHNREPSEGEPSRGHSEAGAEWESPRFGTRLQNSVLPVTSRVASNKEPNFSGL